MVQFIKGSWHYGELDAARMLGEERFKSILTRRESWPNGESSTKNLFIEPLSH
jgi:ATP:corrinoid adenosyltransferase